jgi:cytochrome P450
LRGQYTFKVRELHAKYGPIVRINPYELHVSDPDFYDTLYAGGGKRRERFKWYAAGLGLPDSMLGTIDHDLHRKRRAALNGYFSAQSARKLQPVIQERLDTLIGRLHNFKGSDKIVPMNLAYSAWSNGK